MYKKVITIFGDLSATPSDPFKCADLIRKMLIKAKAPTIEVKGSSICIQDKRLSSVKLFQGIDRIAMHILQH